MVQNVPQPCLKICSWKLFTGRELPGEPWTVGGTCQKTDEATHKWCFCTQRWKIFTRGHYEKKTTQSSCSPLFLVGKHRSDRFYAYSTISKLEMTKTVMMGIKHLLIFLDLGFLLTRGFFLWHWPKKRSVQTNHSTTPNIFPRKKITHFGKPTWWKKMSQKEKTGSFMDLWALSKLEAEKF